MLLYISSYIYDRIFLRPSQFYVNLILKFIDNNVGLFGSDNVIVREASLSGTIRCVWCDLMWFVDVSSSAVSVSRDHWTAKRELHLPETITAWGRCGRRTPQLAVAQRVLVKESAREWRSMKVDEEHLQWISCSSDEDQCSGRLSRSMNIDIRLI